MYALCDLAAIISSGIGIEPEPDPSTPGNIVELSYVKFVNYY